MTFVDECRREWKRLGVPDAVANEMASELAADLAEAEAEGASPEDVLGYAVFDAPAFAAQWAEERGVAAPVHEPPPRRRSGIVPLAVGLVISLAVIAAGIAIFAGTATSHVTIAGSPRVRIVVPPSPRPPGNPPHTAGFVFLGVGIGGVVATLATWWMLGGRRRVIF
jgi:hypothetical protein